VAKKDENLCESVKSVDKKNAFTIVELLVAMTLLVILLGLSGMVFNTTVAAHRAAGASIDVSRNLRAITAQLSSDLRGLRKDAPVFIAFNWIDTDGDMVSDSRFDTIHFFADGDFQTSRTYYYDGNDDGLADDYNGDGKINRDDRYKIVYGNIARVFYGHSNTPGNMDYVSNGTLVRKSHILTSESRIYNIYGEIPGITNTGTGFVDYTPFDASFGLTTHASLHTYIDENEIEFNTITLTNWINALNYLDAGVPNNVTHFITNCMMDASRPQVDLADIDTLHLLFAQGVVQMQVQWAYTADDLMVANSFTGIRWWPSVDPDGDPGTNDSDFITMNRTQLGVYLQLPLNLNVDMDGDGANDWFSPHNFSCGTTIAGVGVVPFKPAFYPRALKFTLTLKDSNGIFADGKTFTHIVYLDN
jgi:type II secretory pathway pseudopilin PulG